MTTQTERLRDLEHVLAHYRNYDEDSNPRVGEALDLIADILENLIGSDGDK
jgi:hypothetical protein